MPYSKLTNVANYDSLLTEIRNFLNATGDWTIHQDLIAPDEDGPSGTPEEIANLAHGHQLVVKQGDCLAGLRSTTGGLGANRLYLFDGVPNWSSSSLDSMPNNSGNRYVGSAIVSNGGDTSCRGLPVHPGPFPTVHLFTNDPSTYFFCAVEVSAGVWRHLQFGNLEKYGTWTGGGFYGCTWWTIDLTFIDQPNFTGHHVPFDNYNQNQTLATTVHYVNGSEKWIGGDESSLFNGVQRRTMRSTFRGGFGRAFTDLPESPYSGLIALAPALVGAQRLSDTPDTLRFIGRVPDMRAVNIRNFAPGESYTIGSDEWVMFPVCAKNGAVDQFNSGNYGVAYLKHA
jgi:hypothetical protein